MRGGATRASTEKSVDLITSEENCTDWFSSQPRCAPHTCVSENGKFAKFCILGRLGSILRKRANEMKPNLRVPPSRYVGKLGGSASRVREGTSHSLLCSTLSTLPVWLFACNTHLTVLCSCHLLCPLLIFLSSAQSTPSRCNSNL